MTSVSVIIPTIGRANLDAAIASALDQSHPVAEVLVMVDVAEPVSIGIDDDRVRVIVVGDRTGAKSARQRGVEAAVGEVIALLDDDDLWHPYKIERQLRFAEGIAQGCPWIASSRIAFRSPGRPDRIIPRRVIGPRDEILNYLYEVRAPRSGRATLQSSTLCFPREIALQVPLDVDPGAVHDEPTWLHRVQQAVPDLVFCQAPECLAVYNVTSGSLSNNRFDDSPRYIEWGRSYLGQASARARGDYFLTNAVTAAAAAHSPRAVIEAVRVGWALGRPGLGATIYAAGKLATTVWPRRRRARRPSIEAQ